jgi:hypothetical protein
VLIKETYGIDLTYPTANTLLPFRSDLLEAMKIPKNWAFQLGLRPGCSYGYPIVRIGTPSLFEVW